MITPEVHEIIAQLSEALHGCGWSIARCERFSAATIESMMTFDRVAVRDRKDIEAAKLLPKLGPEITAERLEVCRRSVYYMAERGNREIVQAKSTACTGT